MTYNKHLNKYPDRF